MTEAAAERVAVDLPCVGCGYNLRSLRHDAACPECGVAVGQSLDAVRLVFVPRARLRVVAGGRIACTAGLVAIPFAIHPAPPIVGAIMVAVAMPVILGGMRNGSVIDEGAPELGPTLGFLGWALGLIGGFLLLGMIARGGGDDGMVCSIALGAGGTGLAFVGVFLVLRRIARRAERRRLMRACAAMAAISALATGAVLLSIWATATYFGSYFGRPVPAWLDLALEATPWALAAAGGAWAIGAPVVLVWSAAVLRRVAAGGVVRWR